MRAAVHDGARELGLQWYICMISHFSAGTVVVSKEGEVKARHGPKGMSRSHTLPFTSSVTLGPARCSSLGRASESERSRKGVAPGVESFLGQSDIWTVHVCTDNDSSSFASLTDGHVIGSTY